MKKIDALKLTEICLKFDLNPSSDREYMYAQIIEHLQKLYGENTSLCSECGQVVSDESKICLWCDAAFGVIPISNDELATIRTERLNPFWLRNRKNMIVEEMRAVLGFAGIVKINTGKTGWSFSLDKKRYIHLSKTGSVKFMGKFDVPIEFEERVKENEITGINSYGMSVTSRMSDKKLRVLIKAYFGRWDR